VVQTNEVNKRSQIIKNGNEIEGKGKHICGKMKNTVGRE
jgi:hypothetical protein